RKQAMQELEKLGDLAEPSLRQVTQATPPLELRQRVEELLARLEDVTPGTVRLARAIEVLEHMNTVEARQLLRALAKGAPAARSTRDAKAALERLAHRA